ncbi:MAG: hypothetical protein ABMA64_01230 [Myxococcota bacterium]
MIVVWWAGCAEDPEVVFARAREARDVEALGASCDGGRLEACALAADAASAGDPRRRGWDERGCEHGVVASCLRRSESPSDPFRAGACALGDAGACLDAGDAAREAGDRATAAERYGARCALLPGDAACTLAERMKAPPDPPVDVDPAALWAKCDADDGLACLHLAQVVAAGAPLPEGAKPVEWLRSQACDLQVVYACAPHHW